jgi:hypothetical protein
MPIRPDLLQAQDRAWTSLGHPGTWWTGADRVAIAAETRHAASCPLCAARAEALSPAMVGGDHATLGSLPGAAVEAIHRIRTDSGRIGESWIDRLMAGGMDEARYVELVSVVAITIAIDTFRSAVGLEVLPLPPVHLGAPRPSRPVGVKRDLCWVSTLAPEDVGPDDPDIYLMRRDGPPQRSGANIQRALSLVPQAMLQWWDMLEVMYMPGPWMRDFTREYRAVSHAQIEMLAARVSALNRCIY